MTLSSVILASTLGKVVHPFFIAFAWLLAEFYAVIPNYAIAIALLTIAVMIVAFPITRRGTRSMMRMQILAPDLKVIQNKYKAKPGMSTAERQEQRQKLNEEMMALYKENGVSPTGGCLPMFLQFPIFIILYDTIRGLTHEVTIGKGAHAVTKVQPLYVSHTSKLYESIVHHAGQLPAFGINLADSVKTHGLSWPAKIPYIAMILIAVALQYVQMKQLSGRNPTAAQANPQMQQMQKVMPLIFLVIYIAIPAGVNVYFVVSSLFRIGQQEFMYRHDPQLRASIEKLRERTKNDPKVAAARALANQRKATSGGLLGRLRPGPAALGSGLVEGSSDKGTKQAGTSSAKTGERSRSRSDAARPAGGSTERSSSRRSSTSPSKPASPAKPAAGGSSTKKSSSPAKDAAAVGRNGVRVPAPQRPAQQKRQRRPR